MNMIFFKNVNDSNYGEIFSNIKLNNVVMYDFILNTLQNKPNMGIREDILNTVNNNIGTFSMEQQDVSLLCKLMFNLKVSSELLLWCNEFIKKSKYQVDDFDVAINAAIEKNIPLSVIEGMFNSDYDEMELLIKIDEYTGKEGVVLPEDTVSEMEPVNETSSYVESAHKHDESAVKVMNSDPGYDEMFNSLITVMTSKVTGESTVKSIEDNLNGIVAKYQLATSELASYSKEILHEIEKKDEEIKKLKALLTIQQKLMSSQQNKISELRSENAHLNTKIINAEKAEMRNEAILQKAKELQNLTLGNRNSDNVFSYIE